MPTVDHSQFLKDLKSLKPFPPVVLLVGEEETLLKEGLEKFKAAFFAKYGNDFPDFNCENLYGESDSPQRVLESCGTLPFGAEKKLVILHHFDKASNDSKTLIEEYCQRPSESTVLMILWNERPGKDILAKPISLAAAKNGALVKCWKPFEDQRPQWISQQLSQEGIKIAPDAARLLSEEGGESLAELRSEIDKLVIFAGEKREVGLQDVREAMSFKRNRTVWNMVEALERGDVRQAGVIMESCLNQGEEALFILNMVARSLRKNSFQLQRQGKSLRTLFEAMKKTDLQLKSGHGHEAAGLEQIFSLLK